MPNYSFADPLVGTTSRYGYLSTQSGQPVKSMYDPITGLPSLAYTGSSGLGNPSSANLSTVGNPALTAQRAATHSGTFGTANKPAPIAPAAPPNPASQYQPIDVVKSPDVANAESDLMKTFQQNASQAMKGFSDYLSGFRDQINTASNAAKSAGDITPTVNALTQAQQTYSGNLDSSNAAYQKALADSAANQRAVVDQAKANLGLYDTAANNIEAQQLAQLQGRISKYKMGTGTPTSLGSAEESMLTSGAANVMLPIEQAKIGQAYNVLGQYALPVEQNIAGQNLTYAGSFLPSLAGSRYGSATNLATTVQSLKNQVAGMDYQNALNYLNSAGVPVQLQQQILSGEISQAGALGQLEDMSRYRGLQYTPGADLQSVVGYNMNLPGYPTYPPRYPGGNGGRGGGNAPIQVGPQQGNPQGQPIPQGASPTVNNIGQPMLSQQALTGGDRGAAAYQGLYGKPLPQGYAYDPLSDKLYALSGGANAAPGSSARGSGYAINPDGSVQYMGDAGYYQNMGTETVAPDNMGENYQFAA